MYRDGLLVAPRADGREIEARELLEEVLIETPGWKYIDLVGDPGAEDRGGGMKAVELDAVCSEVVDDRIEDAAVEVDVEQGAEARSLEVKVDDDDALALLGELKCARDERGGAANAALERVEGDHRRLAGDQGPGLLRLLCVEPSLLRHPALKETPAPRERLHGPRAREVLIGCVCPRLSLVQKGAGDLASRILVFRGQHRRREEPFEPSFEGRCQSGLERVDVCRQLLRARREDEPHLPVRVAHRAGSLDASEGGVRLADEQQLPEHSVEGHHERASSETRPSAQSAAIISVMASDASRSTGSTMTRSYVFVAL